MNQIILRTRTWVCLSLFFMTASAMSEPVNYTISGYIKDASNGEELIGVTVYVDEISNGTITNPYGFYSLTLPSGVYHLSFRYIGYQTEKKEIRIENGNVELNVVLNEEVSQLDEVIIEGEREDENVISLAMSKVEVNVAQMKKLPSLWGEPDLIKTIQMQPGVISAGEGTSAYFVRGGAADQNLILIDEAPVYDPSHLFGMFSVFNSDVIKDSELYKGGIPAQYGGRLSSILEVRTKDGNNQNFSMTGGIGTLASRIMVEGPIKKDVSSYIVSARRSYVDVFQRLSSNKDVSGNLVYFYDINAKVNWKASNKNRYFVAGYFGRDNFSFGGDDAGFDWGNATLTFRWNHLFSDKLFSNTSVIFSNFDYKLFIDDEVQGFDWTSNLQQMQTKFDFSYFFNPRNELKFGYHVAFQRISPASLKPNNDESIYIPVELEKMYGFDHGLYVDMEQTLTDRLSLRYGVRYSLFQNVGDTEIREYEDQTNNITPVYTIRDYDKFELIKNFNNIEPRFSARYIVNPATSLKISYNRMSQNIHLISNSTVPVPFNTWQPSSPYLNSQNADQVAGGVFKNYKDNEYEFSVEAYYKWMYDIPVIADNANIFFNYDLATEFRPGDATSYGLEFYLLKTKGPLQGSLSYTYSKTEYDVPDINQNKPYPANYDRRNSINLAAVYELNEKLTFGLNWVYGTGRPLTIPTGKYSFDGYNADLIAERNGYRMPDFHRMDLSLTLTPLKNKNRKWQSSWVFAIYNVYNRKNPFTIYTRLLQDDDGNVIDPNVKEARMVYLFPVMPSVTYNFHF